MTFYNHQRQDAALAGTPPAVVYWPEEYETQLDQQVQGAALPMPDTVRPTGAWLQDTRLISTRTKAK
jgi:hypothetical protein